MKLIVGLGNPGPKYETTRHNAGFLAVDRLIEAWSLQGPKHQFDGLVWSGSAPNGERVVACKPETYMNLSGKCVGPLAAFLKCEPTDLIVIHDELDLDPMIMRLKTGGGAGGHNGLKSIDAALGAKGNAYHRVRIGVGHPARPIGDALPRRQSPADYVLEQFSDAELEALDPVFENVVAACALILRGDMQLAMNRYHSR